VRIFVNGWGRDHGKKTIIEDDLTTSEIVTGYSMRNAHMQVVRSEEGTEANVVISKGAPLRLNGDYVVHAEISQSEIARLFYLTHSNIDLHDLIEVIGAFKKKEDDRAKAAAELRRKLANIKLANIRRRV
jgi:hypothetical protein